MSTFEGIKEIGFYLRTKKKLHYCLCLLNKTFQKKKEAGWKSFAVVCLVVKPKS
jgi:hypothetical protein